MTPNPSHILCLLLLTLAAAGARAADTDTNSPFAALYDRASREFPRVEFFKPAGTKSDTLTFQLAPMLLQEVGPAGPGRAFGALLSTTGIPGIDSARPTVYFETETVPVLGLLHVRLSYYWFYPPAGGQKEVARLRGQGVRITLNSSGSPVIWEILNDPAGVQLLFIARSLDSAAEAKFGKALPGRRFAIEADLRTAPKTVVARVLEDGPVPMGPMIYLTAPDHAVSTLICRCMPAQAKELAGKVEYQLVPLATPLANTVHARLAENQTNAPSFWPGDNPDATRLEQVLRLPDRF